MGAATLPSGMPLEDSTALTRIEASSAWPSLRLRELVQFRELLYSLVWRDVKVRYKQTVLGAGWVVLQPLLTMAVFSLFLGRLVKVPSDGTPYPLFALAGLVPWMFFSNGLGQASASLLSNGNLIRKVYFPRLMIPGSAILAGLIDLGLSVAVLGAVMLYYRMGLTVRAPLALAYLAMVVVITMGVGLWLAALTIQFRDVRYVVPFLTQFWMFATPVVYPSSLLAHRWQALYGLNPMVGAIEGFRWALLSTGTAPGPMVGVSAVVALVVMVSGAFYFRRIEKSFADVL